MLSLDLELQSSMDKPAEAYLLSSFMKIPTVSSKASRSNYLKEGTIKQASLSVNLLNLTLLLSSPAASLAVYYFYYSIIALILSLFLSVCQCVVALYGFRLEQTVTAARLRFYRRSVKSLMMMLLVFAIGMEALFLMNRWNAQSEHCENTVLVAVCKERLGVMSLDLLCYALLPGFDILLYLFTSFSGKLVTKYTRRLKQQIKEEIWC